MAEGNIRKPVQNYYGKTYSQNSKTVDVDIRNYQEPTAYVFLVIVRSWAALNTYFSIYVVQGIQNGLYQNASELTRGTETESKVECKDANTITITFYNTAGGYYSIVPLM